MRRFPLHWQITWTIYSFSLAFFLYYTITTSSWHSLEILMLILSFVIAYWAGVLLARPLDKILLFLGRVQEGAQGERLLVDQGADWQQLYKLINQLIQRYEDAELHLEEQVKSKTVLLQSKAEHLHAVSEVGRQMAAVLDTHDLLQFVATLLRGTFHYDLVGIFLIEDESLILKAFASRWNSAVENKVEFKLSGTKGPPILQETIGDGIPRINLGQGFTMISNEEYPIQSEVVVAIKKGECVLGALIAQSCLKEAFHEDDLAILTALTAQIAVTLENARLFVAEKQLRELAVLTERNRMAQEIHDTLAQGFLGILLMLRAADPLLEKDPPPRPSPAPTGAGTCRSQPRRSAPFCLESTSQNARG